MSTLGDIMSTSRDIQYIGRNAMSTSRDIQYIGEYHKYIRHVQYIRGIP